MALHKATVTPSGFTAEYYRMESFTWDRTTREASAHFMLYKDAATAVAGRPLPQIAAKLRLYGDKFDEYLSPAALAAAEGDVVAQLYVAAKAVSAAYVADPQDPMPAHLVSDFGRGLFADAEDV